MSTTPSDARDKPHIEIDTQNCSLGDEQRAKIDKAIEPVRRLVARFPVADLYITLVHEGRSGKYRAKLSLILPSKTIVTAETHDELLPAYLRCARKIERRVQTLVAELENEAELRKYTKGTEHTVTPDHPCDFEKLEAAVAAGDYEAFREASYMYEESVRKRAGRWIQRYPEAEARLGAELALSDLVEEVFLNAFESYNDWPRERRFGEWLEDLIDPSLQALLTNPEEVLQEVDFARSYRGAQQGG